MNENIQIVEIVVDLMRDLMQSSSDKSLMEQWSERISRIAPYYKVILAKRFKSGIGIILILTSEGISMDDEMLSEIWRRRLQDFGLGGVAHVRYTKVLERSEYGVLQASR